MTIEISGLKCDQCTYRDDSVQFSEYEKSINKLCPECGGNLLTQTEYDQCVKYYAMVEKYNRIQNITKWFNPLTYFRLLFGIKQKKYELIFNYPNKKV